MALSGEQRKQLHTALCEAFPERPALAQMVRFGLDMALPRITEAANLDAAVYDLIEWAEAQGKLDDLLEAAVELNPSNPALRAIADEPIRQARRRARYVACLRARYTTADMRGLVPADYVGLYRARVPLDEIYVPLHATVVEHHRSGMEMLRRGLAEVVGVPVEDVQIVSVTQDPPLMLEQASHIHEDVPARREHLPLADIVAAGPVVVVLGDPGSGKSALLKHYALKLLAQQGPALPILVPLAAYAQALATQAALRIEDYAADYYAGQEVPDLRPLFGAARRAGQAVFLLDGLDEVPSDLRGQVSDMVVALARTLSGNRLVATSRIAGYIPLALDAYCEATLEPLAPDQVAEFVRKWYTAFFGTHTLASEAWRTADKLLAVLNDNRSVAKLADNPLMLTMLALLFYAGNTDLPRQRIRLYGLVAKTLITEWRKARSLAGIAVGSRHDELEVLKQVGPLAYWMHEYRPEGLATRDDVAYLLSQVERAARPDEDPRPTVDRFLEALKGEIGLLSEKGPGQWGFSHLTFEEYFAAREIARHPSRMASEISRRAPDPRWTEVIRLAVAYLGTEIGATEDVTALVHDTILVRPDPYESFLHRNLLLAGRVLADEPGVSWDLGIDVAHRLFDLWRGTQVRELEENAGEVLLDLLDTGLRSTILRWVLEELQTHRGLAAFRIFAKEVEVREALIAHLTHEDSQVRMGTMWALVDVATKPEVQVVLLERLLDVETNVRQVAIRVLGSVAADMKVRAALLALLADREAAVRAEVPMALWNVATEPDVWKALLEALADEDLKVRLGSAGVLSRAATNPDVRAVLLKRLIDRNALIRQVAVSTLEEVVTEPEVRTALLARLSDKDGFVRELAVKALGGVATDPDVNIALMKRLDDPDASLRAQAAEALARVVAKPEVQAALLRRLADRNAGVRKSAAWALGGVSAKSGVRTALLQRLNDRDSTVREAVAHSLESLVADPAVQAALVNRLTDEAMPVRWQATRVLESVATQPDVRAGLLKRLYDSYAGIWEIAARSLATASPDSSARERLGVLLSSNEFEVAEAAFATLAQWAVVEDIASTP